MKDEGIGVDMYEYSLSSPPRLFFQVNVSTAFPCSN